MVKVYCDCCGDEILAGPSEVQGSQGIIYPENGLLTFGAAGISRACQPCQNEIQRINEETETEISASRERAKRRIIALIKPR